jgi:hypothetical protein
LVESISIVSSGILNAKFFDYPSLGICEAT